MKYPERKRGTLLLIILCISAGAAANGYYERAATAKAKATANSVAPQDVISLDRRLSMLEQRFMNIESGIMRLEQQSSVTSRSSSMDSDTRVQLLVTEITRMRSSIAEIECGVEKLDQRTLTQDRRNGLRRDPCRLNADTPVQFAGSSLTR